jgi:asparagine synthase (glutamine-hydrolysing)
VCGITGVLAFDRGPFRVSERLVTRMRETMHHRGPDGGETWIDPDGRVGLGHRRLSIIDLTTCATQPMSNEDGTVWVVFNGEIYNHAALRAELVALGGHAWKTDHSDTEVLLHAFEQWGIDFIHRLHGMFAFALWDARSRQLWLVRDRIGIKPLYYSVHHGRLTFASEIKALLEDPEQPRAMHEEAFYHYLSFLTTPAPQTLFDGIRKLPAGTWLRVSADGSTEERRYWDVFDDVKPVGSVSDEELAHRILAELRSSVSLRKVSDVPVGIFLSGGLDSSTNAALFSEGESTPVRTFSIGYEREFKTYRNELDYAQTMATRIGSAHHEYRLKVDELIDFLPHMVHLQDEPIADPVCVPLYYVAKLARDNGVTVCQLGEGADEMFIGYPNWLQALERQQWADWPVPRVVKKAAAGGLRQAGYAHAWQYEYLRRAGEGVPLFWGGAEAFSEWDKQQLLSPRLKRTFGRLTSWDALSPIYDRFRLRAPDQSPLSWMSYLDLQLRLPELLLMRVDKMTMGVGLEGRVPFLDHRLVALAMSIPSERKITGGTLKYLLKKAVRGLVPDELIDRRKQGFGVPVDELFEGRLAGLATAEFDRFCADTDVIDRRAIDRLIQTGQGSKVWYLLNLAMWWREYIAQDAPWARS